MARPQAPTRQPPHKKPKNTSTTPENIHIDYLNQEINIAKTKATSLESQIQEKDEKIKILEDRIKAIEELRLSNLCSQYLSPPSKTLSPQGEQPRPQSCLLTVPMVEKVFSELASLKSLVINL